MANFTSIFLSNVQTLIRLANALLTDKAALAAENAKLRAEAIAAAQTIADLRAELEAEVADDAVLEARAKSAEDAKVAAEAKAAELASQLEADGAQIAETSTALSEVLSQNPGA